MKYKSLKLLLVFVVSFGGGNGWNATNEKFSSVSNLPIVYGNEKIEMRCRFSDEADENGEKCYMQIGVIGPGKGDETDMAFRWSGNGGKQTVFVGTRGFADEWRFGTLNSKPAAAYGLNRRHHVFSTTDYQQRFECWYEGWNKYQLVSKLE